MEKISRLTKKNLFKGSVDRAANAALVCHVAKRCMGDFFKKGFLKEIEVVSFREDTLFISTPNSTYSQEIKLKERDILETINKDLNSNIVKTIKFRSNKTQANH